MPFSAGSYPAPPFIQDQVQHRKAIAEWMMRISPLAPTAASGIGYQLSASGTTAMNLEDALHDFISVRRFGALGDGTNQTTAIQAACHAFTDIYIPPGTYLVDSTISLQPCTRIYGAAAEKTIITRVANYSATFAIGTSAAPANNFEIAHLWLYKGQSYSTTTTDITYRVSASAAHVAVYGGQRCSIHDCFVWGMPIGIAIENTSLMTIRDNNFNGIWDPRIASLQEGLASVLLKTDPTQANTNTLIDIHNNHFTGGYFTTSRSTTVGTAIATQFQQIGPRMGLVANACEALNIHGNFFGGQAEWCIELKPQQILAGVRITGNWFDSGLSGGIVCSTLSADRNTNGLIINANYMNGQTNGWNALLVDFPASITCVVNLIVSNNHMENWVAAPMSIHGVRGAQINGNIVNNYNCLAGGSGDPAYAAGLHILPGAKLVFSHDNLWGSGVNGAAANHCQWGTFWNSISSGSSINERSMGFSASAGSELTGGGSWQNNCRPYIHTAAGNITCPNDVDLIIVNKTVAASTQVSPVVNPVPGHRLTFKDGKGDGAANALQFVGTVDGTLNPVYATNYVSVTVVWNGTQWNKI